MGNLLRVFQSAEECSTWIYRWPRPSAGSITFVSAGQPHNTTREPTLPSIHPYIHPYIQIQPFKKTAPPSPQRKTSDPTSHPPLHPLIPSILYPHTTNARAHTHTRFTTNHTLISHHSLHKPPPPKQERNILIRRQRHEVQQEIHVRDLLSKDTLPLYYCSIRFSLLLGLSLGGGGCEFFPWGR